MPPSARDEAARLLATRGLSEAELRQRLLAKGIPPADVDDAVADARERRWLDDAALARAVLREGAGKGRGKDRLLPQLEARGIAPEVAEAAWRDLAGAGEVDPAAVLQHEVERRVRAEGGALTGKAAGRIYNALLRSGHDPERIRSALAPFLGDDDDVP
jgi:SOS response regulatory protein OraA/RecX